jgi:cellulose synthase/poly-beta-1,6-N-acetylglucosamine synthase-like glycosyltransferase
VTDVLRFILEWSQYFVLAYFILVNSFYAIMLVCAALALRRHRLRTWQQHYLRLLGSRSAPRLAVVAPAYNEESTIVESLRSLLTLRYPNLEVVVVNDGSTDRTLQVLEREFDLYRVHPDPEPLVHHAPITGIHRSRRVDQLVVVDKVNGGGKADAMNAGINASGAELICFIDADTLIEPDALLRLVQPYIESDDIAACGGTIRVANGSIVRSGRVVERRAPRRFLPGVQVVEYVRAFLFGRLGWNSLGGNLVISGAFGLFRRDSVAAAGGLLHGTVGEDMELIVRLRRLAAEHGGPGKVLFVPDPVAWTEAPERRRDLAGQRDRWHRGLSDTLMRHRRLFLNPRYGSLGMVAYPYFFLVELLAPLIEAFGLIALPAALLLDAVNWEFAVLLLIMAYGYGMLLTICSLLLEELSGDAYARFRDRLLLIPWVVLETLGYRQVTIVWRLRGIWNYIRGRSDWGPMSRSGFATDLGGEPEAKAG